MRRVWRWTRRSRPAWPPARRPAAPVRLRHGRHLHPLKAREVACLRVLSKQTSIRGIVQVAVGFDERVVGGRQRPLRRLDLCVGRVQCISERDPIPRRPTSTRCAAAPQREGPRRMFAASQRCDSSRWSVTVSLLVPPKMHGVDIVVPGAGCPKQCFSLLRWCS